MTTISICVPTALKAVDVDFFRSFTKAIMPINLEDMANLVGGPGKVMINLFYDFGFPIDVCRNNLCKRALKAESDYIIWLDADQTFEETILMRLLRALLMTDGCDVLSALYCNRAEPFYPVPGMLVAPDDDVYRGYYRINVEKRGIFPVDIIGMGAVAMTGDALKRVSEEGPWFLYQEDPLAPYKGRSISEDIYFCQQCRKKGVKIFCDSSHLVGHMGVINVSNQGFEQTKEQFEKDGWPIHMTDEQRKGRGDIKKWPGS